jgi:hypothetical protein
VEYQHDTGWAGLLTRVFFSRPTLFLLFNYRSAVMRLFLRGASKASLSAPTG